MTNAISHQLAKISSIDQIVKGQDQRVWIGLIQQAKERLHIVAFALRGNHVQAGVIARQDVCHGQCLRLVGVQVEHVHQVLRVLAYSLRADLGAE